MRLSSFFRLDSPHLLRAFTCAACRRRVHICSSCDRGQRYCSRRCAGLARRQSSRRAGSRYQRSERGRLLHKLRQQRYLSKKMTHQGANEPPGASDCPPSACGSGGAPPSELPPFSRSAQEADSASAMHSETMTDPSGPSQATPMDVARAGQTTPAVALDRGRPPVAPPRCCLCGMTSGLFVRIGFLPPSRRPRPADAVLSTSLRRQS